MTTQLSTAPTISSLEIASLTGKQHCHVLASIRSTLEAIGTDATVFKGSYTDSMNREKPCFNLPRRECDLLISGYSVKCRLAVIKRWYELEQAEQASTKPQALNEWMESELARFPI
jgi:anti-repressor protein